LWRTAQGQHFCEVDSLCCYAEVRGEWCWWWVIVVVVVVVVVGVAAVKIQTGETGERTQRVR